MKRLLHTVGKTGAIWSSGAVVALVSLLLIGGGIAGGAGKMSGGESASAFTLSDPPKTSEWLIAFGEITGGRAEPGIVDAICSSADGAMAQAALQLYDDPNFGEAKSRIARIFSGFRKVGAQAVALGVLKDPKRNSGEVIVTESAHNAVVFQGIEGLGAVLDRLGECGDPPEENGLDTWECGGLLVALAGNADPLSKDFLFGILADGRSNSSRRLGAACALIGIRDTISEGEARTLSEREKHPLVKKCLLEIASGG